MHKPVDPHSSYTESRKLCQRWARYSIEETRVPNCGNVWFVYSKYTTYIVLCSTGNRQGGPRISRIRETGSRRHNINLSESCRTPVGFADAWKMCETLCWPAFGGVFDYVSESAQTNARMCASSLWASAIVAYLLAYLCARCQWE